VLKEDLEQLILPTKGKGGALLDFLIGFFEEVVPEASTSQVRGVADNGEVDAGQFSPSVR
jgi:hypothetical protein